jgi:Fe2+ or Zn2+ uptake regulation protein
MAHSTPSLGTASLGTGDTLDRAEAICAHRGTRLTPLRRHVLGLILESDTPVGPAARHP